MAARNSPASITRSLVSVMPAVAVVTTLLIVLVGIMLLLPTLSRPVDTWAFPGFSALYVVVLLPLAYVIATRQPGNPIGWLFLLSAFLGATQMLANHYANYVRFGVGELDTLALIAAWLDAWIWIGVLLPMTIFLFVLFPTGRVRSPAWRWVLIAAVAAGLVAGVSIAFHPDFAAQAGTTFPNLFGIPSLAPPLLALFYASSVVILATIGAGIVALVLGHRSASAVERRQLELLLASGVLVAVSLMLAVVFPSKLTEVLVVLAGLTIPAAATVAILRYRLWDIDIIINRTLVYVPLTGILFGLYSVTVTTMQRVFVEITGETSDAAIVISALALAALFTPVRQRLQAAVDARFKGDPDPSQRLVAFAREVDRSYHLADPVRLARRLAETVHRGMGATGVVVSLARGTTLTVGDEPWQETIRMPLMSGDSQLGEVVVGERRSGRPYTNRDREALQAAVNAVAAVLTGAVPALIAVDSGGPSSVGMKLDVPANVAHDQRQE